VTALVKYFLDRRVTTRVFAPGRTIMSFAGNRPGDFEEFYKSTIKFDFQETVSPAQLFLSHVGQREITETVIFVSHQLDEEILDIMEESREADRTYLLIVNMQGFSPEEQRQVEELCTSFRNRGFSILTVASGMTIARDLGKKEYANVSRV